MSAAPDIAPATARPPTRRAASAGLPQRWPVTVEAYHALAAAGVLAPEERVELVNGQILAMSPVGGPHIALVSRLTMHFAGLAAQISPRPFDVLVQSPLALGPRDEPEPDLALVRPGGSPREVPQASAALLVVEVAEATLRFDRGPKRTRYARAGVPEVWVVDVVGGTVEVARGPIPADGGYAEIRRLGPGDALRVAALPDVPALALALLFDGLLGDERPGNAPGNAPGDALGDAPGGA